MGVEGQFMIAIFSQGGNSLAFDSRRPLQFARALFVAAGYQLGVLVRIVSGRMERRFATFADIPYHDRLSRQHWEQLWRAECQ
jgi:hypothetical protein